MRAIPLTEAGQRFGAIVLMRDVGELRRRERELMTKDATIREIHHRVKNNLQSVAALLRLQSRRLPDGEAKVALAEAERRVGTIAMVHDQLSQGFDETVDFDPIAQRGLNAVVEVSANGAPVHTVTQGSFGRLRAEDATSLAMIMSELVQNAIEHGLGDAGGEVRISIERLADERGQPMVVVSIEDDGKGIDPARRPGSGLGTQIVQSLVGDLQGRITLGAGRAARHPGPVHRADCARSPDGVPRAPRSRGPRRRHTRAAKSPATVTVTGLADAGRAGAQPARRARALRRFRARRSSSERPPQTPASWPVSRAHLRQVSMTGQVRHTAFASSICRMAGPVFPMGKNSSGSASRQAARSRQSMWIVLLHVCRFGTDVRVSVAVHVLGAPASLSEPSHGVVVSGDDPLTNGNAHEDVPYALRTMIRV